VGGGATLGPLLVWIVGWLTVLLRDGCRGFVLSGIADQATVGGPASDVDLDRSGRLVWPCCGPIANVNRGPCGFPTLMLCPS
jgi:hypothetical protein